MLLFFAIFFNIPHNHAAVDLTIQSYAVGEVVVDAVIEKILRSRIFKDDFEFLKRLARFESNFGEDFLISQDFGGGIWRVTEQEYDYTKRGARYTMLQGFERKIYENFGITWQHTVWTDLVKPLHSALAVMMYLAVRSDSIPQTLEQQGTFYENYLARNSKGAVDFERVIKSWEEALKTCPGKLDLVVLLDGSGSVQEDNFEKSIEFVTNLFQSYSLKEVRMGFLLFSTGVEKVFDLSDSFGTIEEVKSRVQDVEYPGGSTNTNEGIIRAVSMFRSASPRPGVPKILAIFTDGKSNMGGPRNAGGIPDIYQARSLNVTAFAIGIGPSISMPELEEITNNNPSRIFSLAEFDALTEFFRRLNRVTCEVPQVPTANETTDDTLERNQRRIYNFYLPPSGITVEIDVNQGLAEGYYSYTFEKPSVALNDGVLRPGSNYIPFKDSSNEIRRSRRDVHEEGEVGGQVYISVVGVDDKNDYRITVTPGVGSTAAFLSVNFSLFTTSMVTAFYTMHAWSL